MSFEMETFARFIGGFVISFLCAYSLIRGLIAIQKKHHYGQMIRDDIVKTHQKKAFTPTLGGISFVISSLFTFFLMYPTTLLKEPKLGFLFLLCFLFFLIGFFDDFTKIRKKNSKGLPAILRLGFELFFIFFFLKALGMQDSGNQVFHFTPTLSLWIGAFCFALFPFIILGSTNAMNLSDGLDGLASMLYLEAMLPFIIASLLQKEYPLALFLIAVYGGILAFLRFNLHPAKIFMGDAGSLFLGAVLAASSLYLRMEGLLILAGLVLIIEALSVMLQVFSYQTRKKRIFLMAPLHHHFEMKGVKEWKVVMVFTIVGFLCSVFSILLLLL